MKNIERFSDRVENYVLYRPHYPAEIIRFLKEDLKLTKQWVIADIGSGTGISSELFISNGNVVYAVEPNPKMRQAAVNEFRHDKNFISVNGTAENTSLSENSIDLIIAGQAFHWFDKAPSKKEFQRIAKPDAYLALIWNERESNSDFQQAYEQMLFEFAPDYAEVYQNNVDETAISDFFSPQPYEMVTFFNSQFFDFEGLKGRLLSCSYAPQEHHPNFEPMVRRLKKIFDQFSFDDRLEFKYNCKLYYGHIRA